jgi:hypothetical protein
MYIRRVTQTNKKTGKEYFAYRLVETYRNSDGKVRQETLLNLGSNFSVPQENWKQLADRIEEIVRGQQVLFGFDDKIEIEAQNIAKLLIHRTAKNKSADTTSSAVEANSDYYEVDINSLQHQQVRQIGAEHIGYEMLKQLEFMQLLSELNINSKQANMAVASIIGRLVSPGSERSTHKYLKNQSALDEILGCDFQKLSLDSLYNIADKLLMHKEVIEERLFQKEKDIFQLEEIITLYDLTNTYFEGKNLKNYKAAYGRSKEKRRDCPLVTLALLLDSSGFPKKSEIFAGNVSEPKTLANMIKSLEGAARPIIILDAGISSEENLLWLKENGYKYIVVSKKNKLEIPEFDESTVLKHKKNYLIKAELTKNPTTLETELYCYSELKEQKEQGMRNQASERYEIELKKIQLGLSKKKTIKKYEKVLERLGRLKEKYKHIGYTYDVEVVTDDAKKNVIDIRWSYTEGKQKPAGVYCLRSNCEDLDEQKLWDIYIMLTELEAAFRCLKSELGLRPIYHQTTKRVDSHIFISILAYHVLHMVRYKLKMYGINESWEAIRNELRTHSRITSTMTCKDGKKIHIRKTSLPNPYQISIYKALNISTSPAKTEKSFF